MNQTFATGQVNGTNVSFSAHPTLVHSAGRDFAVQRVNVFPDVPGGERFEAMHRVSFTGLQRDTWFVVIVRGTDGVSRPMFPVMSADIDRASNRTVDALVDGNLGERGVLAMGVSNALCADVDGVEGFQAPRAP